MVQINKNSSQSLIFTLTEKSRLPSPYYLFSFINDSSGVETLFNMADTSGWPRRFNEMVLTDDSTGPNNPSLGEVDLEYGFGKYKVYESVTQTLVIANTTGRIIEEGIYFVNGYPSTSNNQQNSTDIYL